MEKQLISRTPCRTGGDKVPQTCEHGTNAGTMEPVYFIGLPSCLGRVAQVSGVVPVVPVVPHRGGSSLSCREAEIFPALLGTVPTRYSAF